MALISLLFIICAFLTLLFPKLNFFIPLIVFYFYRLDRYTILWLGFFAGLFYDLLAFDAPFIHILSYTIAIYILYPQKQNFFIDSISTYPILTFFLSSLQTLLLVAFNGFEIPLTLPFIWNDLILYPLGDSLIAFFLFTLPQIAWGPPVKTGKDYFI